LLHYSIEGEGETLVFLHGFLESNSMWNYLDLQQLNYRKVFIELPGHGNSSLTDSSDVPTMQFFADEVKAVLTFLAVDSFSVIGHSMGAYVALLLKEQLGNCQKVVLLNSNFWADNEQKKKDRVRVAEIAFKAKKIFINEAIPNLFGKVELFQNEIEALKEEAMKIEPESIAYAALAMRERKDFSELVSAKPSDFFLIHGDLDRLVATDFLQEQTAPLLQERTNSQLFIIENAGHMAHIEASEKVLEVLKGIKL
jgi:2-succinyl-6-hydroxy-2,4-cyclohexadiene-1-carboxylate synthase